ncbi:PD-(D/E)XK nuclease family protein, partial [bacterium]|nr:PD-(D/E)XK nuclease family protein [candidate division CSSED10-310 bacterium]
PEDPGAVAVLVPSAEVPRWQDMMAGHILNHVRKEGFAWREIAVMFPRRTRLDEIKKTLRATGIPFSVYKGSGFWQQPEIRDLAACIHWFADPGNRTALFTVLRSPLFNLSDETLLMLSVYESAFPGPDPAIPSGDMATDALLSNGLPDLEWPDRASVNRARTILRKIRDMTGMMPLTHLMETILTETGGWGAYAVEDDSGQIAANIEKFLDILLRFDREGVAPVWETSRYIAQREAGDDQEGEALLAGGDDRVTLLTVHAAKGLEFPVVYIVDIEQEPRHFPPPVLADRIRGVGLRLPAINPELPGYDSLVYRQLWNEQIARETAERKRLMYVAFTRARDRLFIVHRPSRRADIQAPRYPGNRWMDWIGHGIRDGAAPCIHTVDPAAITHRATPGWELIRSLTHRPPSIAPNTLLPLPADDDPEESIAVTTLRDYLFNRAEYTKKHVHHMTDHFRAPDSDPTRETARRLGEAYHIMMEHHAELEPVSLDGVCTALEQDLAAIPLPERTAAVKRLQTMASQTRSWLHYAAVRDGKGYHELPFNIPLGTGAVHGIIDLLLAIDGTWTIVDYKTDRKPSRTEDLPAWLDNHRREHRFQMSVYALAIQDLATNQETIPVLVFFADAGETIRYDFDRSELDELADRLRHVLAEIRNGSHGE